MNKRDLRSDFELLELGLRPSGVKLVSIATHAIERAIKAEELARELVDMLGRVTPRYLEGRLELDLDLVSEANWLLEKAKEVLGDE